MKTKFAKLERQELNQEKMQAESYKSTISHELRTPLETSGYFLKRIIELIEQEHLSRATLKEVKKKAQLILA